MSLNEIAPSQPIAGFIGLGMGAAALLMVLVHFWAGPFATQQRVAVTVGEIAADMRQAAVRKLKGLPQPKPVSVPWDSDSIMKLVAALLAGMAIIVGVVGLVRHEVWRPAAGGITLGVGAIAFQVFTWAILVVAGALIIVAIIQNFTDIIGE